MANPWFPAASALSPPLLTPGDRRDLIPPDPPDPDPNNPLSLALFPPLSPISSSIKTSKTSRTLLNSGLIPDPKSLSNPSSATTPGTQKASTSVNSDSSFPKSKSTVQTLENYRVLPPKNSSPILTNLASKPNPILPPSSETPLTSILPPPPLCSNLKH